MSETNKECARRILAQEIFLKRVSSLELSSEKAGELPDVEDLGKVFSEEAQFAFWAAENFNAEAQAWEGTDAEVEELDLDQEDVTESAPDV